MKRAMFKEFPKGIYNTRRNSKNKKYAIKAMAIELIKEQPELLEDIKELWYRVSNGSGMSKIIRWKSLKPFIRKITYRANL